MASVATHPPILLQQQPRSTPTFESFLMDAPAGQTQLSTVPDSDNNDTISLLMRQFQSGEDYNRYAFSQYVMVLYTKIFVTADTSHIIQDMLQKTIRSIAAAYNERRITDGVFGALIRNYIDQPTKVVSPSRGRAFVEALQSLRLRLDLDAAYPKIADIFSIVLAIYDDRPAVASRVELYEVAVSDISGYDTPTLRLIPTSRVVTIDTTGFVMVPDLGWKFIYSLRIPQSITEPNEFIGALYGLARLALPLDPIALTTTMCSNLTGNNKTGVPFLNYLAMYLRQRAMGTDYQLSRLADTRRLLMQRMHQFCGVGATFIKDGAALRPILNEISTLLGQDGDDNPFSDEDQGLYQALMVASSGLQTLQLTRRLRYNASSEAADPKKVKPAPEEEDPKPDDTDAFADDPDPHTDDPQTDNDNIDSQADSGSESEPRPVSKFLPLALPTETVDDLLYRLAVLRFVSDLITTPDPTVSNEAVSLLKTWCGSLLFIASSETTRALITQLKLTGKLKEFK